MILLVSKAPVIKPLTVSMLATPAAATKKAMIIYITVSKRQYIFMHCIAISLDCLTMTRDEGKAIINLPEDRAIDIIIDLAENERF
jgi:hypothetical protein